MSNTIIALLIIAAIVGVVLLVYRSRRSRTLPGTGLGGPRSINRDTRPR